MGRIIERFSYFVMSIALGYCTMSSASKEQYMQMCVLLVLFCSMSLLYILSSEPNK